MGKSWKRSLFCLVFFVFRSENRSRSIFGRFLLCIFEKYPEGHGRAKKNEARGKGVVCLCGRFLKSLPDF